MTNLATNAFPLDSSELEVRPELEKPLDSLQTPTETEIQAESDSVIAANWQVNEKTRKDAIAAGALTKEEADEFQILENLPKGVEIKKEFEEVTADIKNGSDDQEKLDVLKRRQAELVIEYSYNTLALLWHYYTKRAIELVELAKKDVEQTDSQNKSEKEKGVREKFTQLRTMANNLDVFEKNIDRVIPESAKKFPQIADLCRLRNANLMTFLGRNNQFDDSKDQVVRELGRFADELDNAISFDKIAQAEDSLLKQISDKAGGVDKDPVNQAQPKDKLTPLEEGLEETAPADTVVGLDGQAGQEKPYGE